MNHLVTSFIIYHKSGTGFSFTSLVLADTHTQEAGHNKNKRRLLWLPLGLVAAAVGTLVGISLHAAYSMTRVPRSKIEKTPGDLGLKYEDISFASKDGLTLRGWWLETENSDKAVIMLHGAGGHRSDIGIGMLDIAREMVNAGYNVLTFDMRGHGESDGDRTSMGYYEQRDLLGAIDYLRERGMKKICVIGFSMGAATALMTAGHSKGIDAIVADSSFANLSDLVEPQFSKRSRLPKLFIPLVLNLAKIVRGIDISLLNTLNAVRQRTIPPVLFIHGEQDETTPVSHSKLLAKACRNKKSNLWIVPDAGHVGAYRTCPREYIEQVLSFFDQVLGARHRQDVSAVIS